MKDCVRLTRSILHHWTVGQVHKKVTKCFYILLWHFFSVFHHKMCVSRDDTHMTSMKIIQFSRPPTPLVQLRPKSFHPLDLGCPISNEPPPPHLCIPLRGNIRLRRNSVCILSISSERIRIFKLNLAALIQVSIEAF